MHLSGGLRFEPIHERYALLREIGIREYSSLPGDGLHRRPRPVEAVPLIDSADLVDMAYTYQPQSFRVPEVRLLIVLMPGFGCGVRLVSAGGCAVVPGVPGCAPAPTAPGSCSFRVAGTTDAGQAGAGRAQSRCQQVRKAPFHGQSGLIFRIRCRA
jgi:hypothetical protein